MPIPIPVIEDEEEEAPPPPPPKVIPPYGTKEWIQYVSEIDGHLPSPIPVSITGSEKYSCPPLQWYNFDVYPHKVKLTNTGFTALIGAKWRTERPYIEGGPLLEKHVFSQIHFHWGANLMEGSDHIVDNRKHPGEMHVTFFRSEYLTQEEAFQHPDGVAIFCYLITHGLEPDPRLEWVIEGFKRVQESKKHTRIGPRPMSKLIPMFFEDYFLYWGTLQTSKSKNFICRWIIPRCVLSADEDQMKQFHKLWDPYDEPIVRNFRPLQAKEERTVFFISPHWSQYNSLLPLPKSLPETSISILSQEYATKPWMLPPQNAYMISEQSKKDDDAEAQRTSVEKQMITGASDK